MYKPNPLEKATILALVFAIGCFFIATFIPSVSNIFNYMGGIGILIFVFFGFLAYPYNFNWFN